jgi:Flp pilus assembly protein TadD
MASFDVASNICQALDHGLLLFARKEYAGAKKQFEAVLAVHPWDAEAANNCAAACMYTCDLRGGIRRGGH